MSGLTVFFRVDASLTIGVGHVMRCLTLSDELLGRGIKVVFICTELEVNLIQLIKNRGIEVHAIVKNILPVDYEQTKNVLNTYESQYKVLIIDSYIHDIEWETLIKRHVDLLISIDDNPRFHNVDILIDNNYKAETVTFYKENLLETKKLLGSFYVLLRSEFINYQAHVINKEFLIHVFFGGADYNNYTYFYSEKILEYKNFKVHAVVSNSFSYVDTLKELKSQYGDSFEYSISPKNMAEIMEKCTIALGAPGTTTWERMAMGLPCAYLATNNNQIPILQEIQSDKLGIYLGKASKEMSSEQIQSFLKFVENVNLQNEIAKNGKQLIDGQGSKRITDFIINTLRGSY
ncbi:Spore coat polysaccharide biosynthesis protein, predicted glycosyltransferase [Solibacillus isronensis B3W22]|uniref:Spore coat polysaccharide biosynthesis protein, predicted glycosyltransferase n=1 Tax=Solibacillus isronensis B3W22 TaxID=1224748 RepID=K1KWV4_9BACL|nr:UDP-2,4-diacetamido-2,4,6-trideoxy-beta-L-altropyranose hydrolase [Solibacillus isronensis]AMO84405.1 hypothetical protein SOLI23_02140 [Solibacillus silvestris]EKB44352.1 Spore coat polysaccharide biosynthesis protein, predicted glycosyltransferase [Solibacillus isronensis B3W22]